jgi:hypothetical protein
LTSVTHAMRSPIQASPTRAPFFPPDNARGARARARQEKRQSVEWTNSASKSPRAAHQRRRGLNTKFNRRCVIVSPSKLVGQTSQFRGG